MPASPTSFAWRRSSTQRQAGAPARRTSRARRRPRPPADRVPRTRCRSRSVPAHLQAVPVAEGTPTPIAEPPLMKAAAGFADHAWLLFEPFANDDVDHARVALHGDQALSHLRPAELHRMARVLRIRIHEAHHQRILTTTPYGALLTKLRSIKAGTGAAVIDELLQRGLALTALPLLVRSNLAHRERPFRQFRGPRDERRSQARPGVVERRGRADHRAHPSEPAVRGHRVAVVDPAPPPPRDAPGVGTR